MSAPTPIAAENPVRPVEAFFLLCGLFLIITPQSWHPEWFFPKVTGTGALLFVLILHLPQLFKNKLRPATAHQAGALRRLQRYCAVAFLVNFAGALGLFHLHQYGFQFDKIAHFAVPMLFTIALTECLRHFFKMRLYPALAYSIIIVLFSGALWEVFEYSIDQIFGTKSFGLGGTRVRWDTSLDTLANLAGACTAFLLVRYKSLESRQLAPK